MKLHPHLLQVTEQLSAIMMFNHFPPVLSSDQQWPRDESFLCHWGIHSVSPAVSHPITIFLTHEMHTPYVGHKECAGCFVCSSQQLKSKPGGQWPKLLVLCKLLSGCVPDPRRQIPFLPPCISFAISNEMYVYLASWRINKDETEFY